VGASCGAAKCSLFVLLIPERHRGVKQNRKSLKKLTE
jgi:hypothetical protein